MNTETSNLIMVPKSELSDWLTDAVQVGTHLKQAYLETISDICDDLLLDPRSSANDHIVNTDFIANPKFIMGYQEDRKNSLFIISCLYVFPKHQGTGLAKYLLDTAKKIVGSAGVIQVAVEEGKLEQLEPFYLKMGFKTFGDVYINKIGKGYRDYFWATDKLFIERNGNMLNITRAPVMEGTE